MIHFLLILLAFGLVLLNAFFVAAEFGMVKLRHTRVAEIESLYGLKGKILQKIHNSLDVYLSACQLGITLASLGLGWIGEPAFAELLEPLFKFAGISSPELTQFIAFFVAFSFLTFLHIVIGELMPKSLAIRQSERVSLWTAIPLYVFYWVMYPAIWLLNACSNFFLRKAKLDQVHTNEANYSSEEIKLILHSTHLYGELTKEEIEILEQTMDFADLDVTDIMRPTEEMTALEKNQSIEVLQKIILETRYSRYPIYEKSIENIIGIIHIKDLLAMFCQFGQLKDLKSLIRPILKVKNDLPTLKLLQKFREGLTHFALVYSDDKKAPIGFITLDNLLHILIGHIKDEFHKTRDEWIVLTDGSFLMNSNCSIYAVERALDIDIIVKEEEEEGEPGIRSLGGLILKKMENIPKAGDKVEFDDFTAVVQKMRGPRILQVRIYPKTKVST